MNTLLNYPGAKWGMAAQMCMGRKGYGCELNSGYFADAVGYLRAEEAEVEQPSLFDMVEQEGI